MLLLSSAVSHTANPLHYYINRKLHHKEAPITRYEALTGTAPVPVILSGTNSLAARAHRLRSSPALIGGAVLSRPVLLHEVQVAIDDGVREGENKHSLTHTLPLLVHEDSGTLQITSTSPSGFTRPSPQHSGRSQRPSQSDLGGRIVPSIITAAPQQQQVVSRVGSGTPTRCLH